MKLHKEDHVHPRIGLSRTPWIITSALATYWFIMCYLFFFDKHFLLFNAVWMCSSFACVVWDYTKVSLQLHIGHMWVVGTTAITFILIWITRGIASPCVTHLVISNSSFKYSKYLAIICTILVGFLYKFGSPIITLCTTFEETRKISNWLFVHPFFRHVL